MLRELSENNSDVHGALRQWFLTRHNEAWMKQEGIETMNTTELFRKLNEVEPKAAQAIADAFIANLEQPDPYAAERERNKRDAMRDFNIAFVTDLYHGIPIFNPTFEDFDTSRGINLQEAKDAVLEWLEGRGNPWLLLGADPGRGKSHLLVAAARVLLSRGETILYRSEAALLDEWKQGFDNHSQEAPYAFKETPWLILDDLGAFMRTDWEKSTLDALIDHRYSMRYRTLFATNVASKALPQRMSSRLGDVHISNVILIEAPDSRKLDG
jgi:DNA replication protein DnaC